MRISRADRRRLDETLRALDPVAVALVESFVAGRVDRRSFLRRGAIIGMSLPMLGAITQACSSDDGPTRADTSPNGDTRTGTTPTATGPQRQPGQNRPARLVVGVQRGDANSGLDPLNMTEVGTYAVVAQSFEYLVGTDPTGAVDSSGLAASWSPNDEGSVWTFVLRDGPRWSDGRPLAADDVAATLERLATVGNGALDGVIDQASVDIADDRTVVVSLLAPNGNFPILLSAANPQSLITPADYINGTTLDERVEGTGAWILESFDAPAFSAVFRRNPDWWGAAVALTSIESGESTSGESTSGESTSSELKPSKLESIELRGFDSVADSVVAIQLREIDVVSQFTAIDGSSLMEDPTLRVVNTPSAAHRQIWLNTRRGLFEDRRLRQAVAWAMDRSTALSDIAGGRGALGNDHPVRAGLGSMPFFDPGAIGQRSHDIDRAAGLVADAGAQSTTTVLRTNELPDARALAEIVARSVREVGMTVEIESEPGDTFYRDTWCPIDEEGRGGCVGSAEFGIIEYEHQALPDVAIGRGFVTDGAWNASNYSNPDLDRLFVQYQRSVDLEDQRRSIGQIQAILWSDVPAIVPYFDDISTAHDSAVTGVRVLASGQPVLSCAAKS